MYFDFAQHKQKGNILIFLLVGALVLGVAAGTFYLRRQTTPKSSPASMTTSPIPRTTPNSSSISVPNNETVNWKTYTVSNLGIQFKLPPDLSNKGSLKEKTDVVMSEAGQGRQFCARILKEESGDTGCDSEYFGISTLSRDYNVGRGAGFIDVQGFIENSGSYNVRFFDRGQEIPNQFVTKLINPGGVTILKIKSFHPEDEISPLYHPGNDRIGALININNNPYYDGFNVAMTLNEQLTEKVFDQILSTFKFL